MKISTLGISLLLALCISFTFGQVAPENKKIWIDKFMNEASTNASAYLKLNVYCGPDGINCNNRVADALVVTTNQDGPWNAGEEPIGGERYHHLVIDGIQPTFVASTEDNVEVSYDQTSRVRFATSPGISGTYTLFWNGPGNNNLPCYSTINSPCALDGSCCANQPGFTVGGMGLNGGSVDLTNGGTQVGLALMQKACDHTSPIIFRIWRADGKSVVYRQELLESLVQRSYLFLWKDFVSFPGDNLSQADVMDVIKNARAIAFQLYGAIALDAKFTSIETVGVGFEKKLDDTKHVGYYKGGDRVCWTVAMNNNAPTLNYTKNNTYDMVLNLSDVAFKDLEFASSGMTLDRSSISIISNNPGLTWTVPVQSNPDLLLVVVHSLNPGDTVNIKFCATVRSDFKSDKCIDRFCNKASLELPGYGLSPIISNETCIDIKYEAKVELDMTCPTDELKVGETAVINMLWRNTGYGPATDAKLFVRVEGLPSTGFGALNPDFICFDELMSTMGLPMYRLVCRKELGTVLSGQTGTSQFKLDLSRIACPYNKLHVVAMINETCSNTSDTEKCDLSIPQNVRFEIYKDPGVTGAVAAGRMITYTITYRNAGNTAASGVYILEDYAADTYPAPGFNAEWTCDTTRRQCRFDHGTLEAQSSIKTIRFVVIVFENTTVIQVCNEVTITSGDNNTAAECKDSQKARACVPVQPGIPDTAIVKKGVIGLLKYKISYENNGNIAAPDTVLRETIPEKTNFYPSESDTRWVCSGNMCTLNLGTLAPGAKGEVDFALMPIEDWSANVSDCYNNVVTISSSYPLPDLNPLDNTAEEQLGNCGFAQFKCPAVCEKCPDCDCRFDDCDCRKPMNRTCPVKECKFPIKSCDVKRCDCPPVVCTPCKDMECKCDNPCPVIVPPPKCDSVTYEECS